MEINLFTFLTGVQIERHCNFTVWFVRLHDSVNPSWRNSV